MVDETKPNPFASADAPAGGDKTENAESTTAAGVTDAEASSLDGAGGPNRTPAFTKRDGEDENTQLTDTDDLASAKAGAVAGSAPSVDLIGLEAAELAGDVREGAEDEVQYTSTPIAALKIGRFQFTNGVLRLSGDDVETFEKLLKGSAIRTQQVVRKIDRRGGEAVARRFLESTQGTKTSGVDTSDRGPQAPRPQA